MVDHAQIYQQAAERYNDLVMREDYQGNILRAVEEITTVAGKNIVEMGAGTGRITCLLAPKAKSILALDKSPAMLRVARTRLANLAVAHCRLGVADHRNLPVANRSADVVLAGWTISYLAVSGGENWRLEVEKALLEMQRVVQPGGTMVLLETLGTGFESPTPPKGMVPYLALLGELGFSSRWIRTDYRFSSLDEAVDLCKFFFGEELANQVQQEYSRIVPECTGIWWKKG